MQWYRPIPASPGAERVLACAWTAEPGGPHLLVPDACAELLWIRRPAPTTDRPAEQLVLCGPERAAWTFELPAGTVAAGVRLRPGIAHRVLGVDVSTVADRRVDPADVLGREVCRRLLDALAADPRAPAHDVDVLRRTHELERFVMQLDAANPDPDADRFVETVLAHVAPPGVRVDQRTLAAVLDLSPRQLHRRMLRTFGHGTATIARLLRFQRFLAYTEPALADGERSLARLATLAGYADQPHLARDCRAITGRTVSAFLRDYFPTFPDMSDPFKTPRPLAPSLGT